MAGHRVELFNSAGDAVQVVREEQLSVFGAPGSGVAGNDARILLCENEPEWQVMQAAATESGSSATCFAWPRLKTGKGREHGGSDARDAYEVRCFSPAGPIRCCGHGLLGTAWALWEPEQCHPLTLWPAGADHEGESRSVKVLWRKDMPWIALPRLFCQSAPVPEWVFDAFATAPIATAMAGNESGYLVLEFASGVPLEDLAVNLQAVSSQGNTRSPGRAVIITQWGENGVYDFLLRYFAPQYGVNEDGVTGSANRVLADYWHQARGLSEFRAWQCSATGGEVYTAVREQMVEVGGTVKRRAVGTAKL